MSKEQQVAQILVESLVNAGVKVVFGIPGAKIDALFNTLVDHPEIKLIVCRHEQNAAFMAAAMGRITGIPGVAIATSGPGASNLTTGLATATTEGDPMIAIVGSVPRLKSIKHTQQSMRTLEILGPVSKSAVNVEVEDQAAEVILSAFRTATTSPKGAAVISLPSDVASEKSQIAAFPSSAFKAPGFGPAPASAVKEVAKLIDNAKMPVVLLGMRASSPIVVSALHDALTKNPIPVVETFQAAGAVSQKLAETVFFGRVGFFQNQVGDRLLQQSDLVIAIGYDPTEYGPAQWNPDRKLNIVHVDFVACDYEAHYAPSIELLGSLAENIKALSDAVTHTADSAQNPTCQSLRSELISWRDNISTIQSSDKLIHPLYFISALQKRVPKNTTVTCDVGTVYLYMMRYFFAYEPRRLLCSNGQQTLGIGMPWAIAASLCQDPPCSEKVISVSGDGGFMFSVQELSTAVQQGCNITHFLWNSVSFNMVEFQEELKYGRGSGVALGGVDFPKLAESFGGKGFRVSSASELEAIMDEALAYEGFSLVEVMIDYSEAQHLAQSLIKDGIN